MKTIHFYQKNSNVTLTLSANNMDEAFEIFEDHVKDTYGWRISEIEGEDEDWDDLPF